MKFENFFDGSFFVRTMCEDLYQNKFFFFTARHRKYLPKHGLTLKSTSQTFVQNLNSFVYIMRNNCFFL